LNFSCIDGEFGPLDRLGYRGGSNILPFSNFSCDTVPSMMAYAKPLSLLSFLCLAVCLFLGPMAIAEESGRELDDLAKRFSKQIEKAGIASIVVADFVGQDGTDSVQGRYLADEFAQRLERHMKKFVLIGRKQLSAALSDAQLSAKDLAAPDSLRRIGDSLRVEAIVTGTVETSPSRYSVRLTVRRVRDGSSAVSGDQSIKRPAYVDLLDADGTGQKIPRAGVDGVGVPNCVHCPPPQYTGKARAAKIQGNVALLVVINQEGRAIRIAVTSANDEGLAAKAVEAVREWKFKPAKDKEGKAVAVIVPIEVSFRLY
jgi:TonB family protein